MEWVETTAKTVEEAREAALDRLGVDVDEAEFEILEEPRPGLFGRVRGEARLRARVRPAQVRPKQDRRRSRRGDGNATASNGNATPAETPTAAPTEPDAPAQLARTDQPDHDQPAASRQRRTKQQETAVEETTSTVTPQEVGDAAVTFLDGLTTAFGASGTVTAQIVDQEIDVTVSGTELGLLVGPGGRTLNAIQDLARVAAQRRLGDHDTRLRVDIAGYRERREAALAQFARSVAEQVRSTGVARSLEPMSSADRKVVHDIVNDEDGVTSRSIGDDPDRRIIVEPA